jgi:hypothetical protein
VGGRGHQTYDLLREGVDYFMDKSMLWFALARELNETNERLVVAYNVRLNGRDTIWTTTGGTPDLQVVRTRDQVANLVWEPNLSPSSAAFRREIRSVYRLAGEDLVRASTHVRVVTGTGLLERPIAGGYATFLQMLGLAKSTSPSEFDYDNRIWPRTIDGVFNLGAGAPDVRNGLSPDIARLFRDHFIVFPSLRPFSARDSGLVVPGNPTNDAIYTTPGEYLYSVQHPSSIYRLRLDYQAAGTDDGGIITVGATQMRPGSERVVLEGPPARSRSRLPHRLRHRTHRVPASGHAVRRSAQRGRQLRGQSRLRTDADDARRVCHRDAAESRRRELQRDQPVTEHAVHAAATRLSRILNTHSGCDCAIQLGRATADATRQQAAVRHDESALARVGAGRDREQSSTVRRAEPGSGLRRDLRGRRRDDRSAR